MTLYICSNCGYGTSSWMGRCPHCETWNTLELQKKDNEKNKKDDIPLEIVNFENIKTDTASRIKTSLSEFNRVLGEGFVKGEVVLLTGEPGVGKSTLLLQGLEKIQTLYISGEESAQQVKNRAERLHLDFSHLFFSDTLEVTSIINGTRNLKKPIDILVIDSIQTIYSQQIEAPYGSIIQLKECSNKLISFAKEHDIIILLIGHITKGGDIAGPKTLEHMVDAVIHFEGERDSQIRILRSKKNRFGSTDEIGMFEMKEKGLEEVTNPTVFLDESLQTAIPGKVFIGIMEGRRPLFLEIQILATKSFFSMPRRVVKGIDYNKFLLLLAVAQKHMNLSLESYDIYANVMGGMSITSPAADLGILVALRSSLHNNAIPHNTLFIGEVGLLGEIRSVPSQSKIISEAKRHNFSQILSSDRFKHVKELPK